MHFLPCFDSVNCTVILPYLTILEILCHGFYLLISRKTVYSIFMHNIGMTLELCMVKMSTEMLL